MLDLFGNESYLPKGNDSLKNKDGRLKHNPLIGVYGPGPDDRKCKHCKNLYFKSYGKRYFKCKLRKSSSSPATDHRVNFPACSKFESNE